MTYTLGTLRRLGLDKEFTSLLWRYVPKTANDQEAKAHVRGAIEIAEKVGIVGAEMMRQLAKMRLARVVDPGLYAEIIKLHKRAAEMIRERSRTEEEKADVDLGDQAEDAEEAGESSEAPEAEAAEGPKAQGVEEGDGNGEEGDEEEGDEEDEAEEESEVEEPMKGVEERKFEDIKYLTAPHPLKPKAIEQYADDFLFPVPPERLWRYKTALYKSFAVLAKTSRTKDKHFRACSRKGVSKAQFDTAWRTWERDGKRVGWQLVEGKPGEFQLQPMRPIG